MDNQRQIKNLLRRMGRVEIKSSGIGGGGITPKNTYTPTYTGSVTAGTTTYSAQQGWYWIIGRGIGALCFVTGIVVWTAATGTGNAQISLPFAVSATFGFRAPVNLRTIGVTFANGSLQGIVSTSAALFTMESPITNGLSTAVAVEAAGNVTFSCFYGITI